jgi:RNAse (barnase) inhibitor barstar
MKHPYTAFERHPQWDVLKNALEDLVANQDLKITTADSYVIGYLLSKMVNAAPVVVDWATCESAESFYDLVLPQCGSPSWHGRNLDALNDSWVTGDIDTNGPPFSFCFLNGRQTPADLMGFRDAVEEIARDSITENGGQIHKIQNMPVEATAISPAVESESTPPPPHL